MLETPVGALYFHEKQKGRQASISVVITAQDKVLTGDVGVCIGVVGVLLNVHWSKRG